MPINEVIALGSALAAALITIAAFIPKLLRSIKRDNLDTRVAGTQQSVVDEMYTSYERQLEALNERVSRLDSRLTEMDNTIHSQAIKITRLTIVIMHLRALLLTNAITIPDQIQDEIDVLTQFDEGVEDHRGL
ncbi:MAG: hypothetical protein F2772_11255 [Actinobacteria bacterium]|nr:hypothetical protein [Actinomycetota bacterium]